MWQINEVVLFDNDPYRILGTGPKYHRTASIT